MVKHTLFRKTAPNIQIEILFILYSFVRFDILSHLVYYTT